MRFSNIAAVGVVSALLLQPALAHQSYQPRTHQDNMRFRAATILLPDDPNDGTAAYLSRKLTTSDCNSIFANYGQAEIRTITQDRLVNTCAYGKR